MSLGWLTESSLLPKRPKQIEEVGKASMVDLRAALYQSEETLQQTDGSLRAEEQERRMKRKADVLGGMKNRGVAERDAADVAYELDEQRRVEQALKRKASTYEALMRGDTSVAPDDCLVDFEMKQMTGLEKTHNLDVIPPAQRPAFLDSELAGHSHSRSGGGQEHENELLSRESAERARMAQRQGMTDAEKRHLMQVRTAASVLRHEEMPLSPALLSVYGLAGRISLRPLRSIASI